MEISGGEIAVHVENKIEASEAGRSFTFDDDDQHISKKAKADSEEGNADPTNTQQGDSYSMANPSALPRLNGLNGK